MRCTMIALSPSHSCAPQEHRSRRSKKTNEQQKNRPDDSCGFSIHVPLLIHTHTRTLLRFSVTPILRRTNLLASHTSIIHRSHSCVAPRAQCVTAMHAPAWYGKCGEGGECARGATVLGLQRMLLPLSHAHSDEVISSPVLRVPPACVAVILKS